MVSSSKCVFLSFLGIVGLRGQDLSHVTVEFQETTPKGQSSHRVDVLGDGSFVVSSDWILETPGKYELSKLNKSKHILLNDELLMN